RRHLATTRRAAPPSTSADSSRHSLATVRARSSWRMRSRMPSRRIARRRSIFCAVRKRTNTPGGQSTSRCSAEHYGWSAGVLHSRPMLRAVQAPLAIRRAAVVAEVLIRLCRAEDLPQLEWFGMYAHHREILRDAFARHMRGDNLMLVADLNDFPVAQAWL